MQDNPRAGQPRPSRSVVYVVTNPAGPSAVEAFSRDPESGRIAHLGRFETGGKGDPFVGGLSSHAIVGNRRHVYAVNPGDDTISAFAIEKDGSLRLLDKVPSGGRRPASLALHGSLLYAVNQGNVPGSPPDQQLPASYTGFRVRDDGRLDPISGSTVALEKGDSPGEILFNHDGSRLIACRLAGNTLDVFDVTKEGLLARSAPLRGQPGPFGSIFSPADPSLLLVALAGAEAGLPAPGVASYRIGEGPAQQISVVTDKSLQDPCWLAIAPDGRRLWASSFIPRSLTLYSIDEKGQLTQRDSHVPASGPGSTDVALDPSARFLYQLRAFDVVLMRDGKIVPEIAVFRLTGDAGSAGLAPVQSLPMPADLDRAGVTGMLVIDLD